MRWDCIHLKKFGKYTVVIFFLSKQVLCLCRHHLKWHNSNQFKNSWLHTLTVTRQVGKMEEPKGLLGMESSLLTWSLVEASGHPRVTNSSTINICLRPFSFPSCKLRYTRNLPGNLLYKKYKSQTPSVTSVTSGVEMKDSVETHDTTKSISFPHLICVLH